MVNCPKCGTEVEVPGYASAELQVKALTDWKLAVKKETATKLCAYKTKVIKGNGFRTLFVSSVARAGILSPEGTEESLVKAVRETYANKVAPVLDTINENFEILGALAEPSSMRMAIVDLSVPAAVFCFVTIQDTPFVDEKLAELGLTRLTDEGHLQTV